MPILERMGLHDPYNQHQVSSNEQFLWEVTAQLAAGMFANPSRSHLSVKESIALFDELMHEMEMYMRVKGITAPAIAAEMPAAPSQSHMHQAPSPPRAAPVQTVRRPAPLPTQAQWPGGSDSSQSQAA